MTETMSKRPRRAIGAMVAASLAVVAVLGPGPDLVTRLGASEQVAFATVSAADIIRSEGMLAEVAAGRLRVSNRT
ncbi:hypothetical protein [Actinoplanes sp. RD1]|uniref:hypothetical protein n=1 Tax=Actinoplanes sp. RD1 TaxID=3064538 RepID=UPI002740C5FC|nr:hypothetical protein [Actinoplanes sp. RD1]